MRRRGSSNRSAASCYHFPWCDDFSAARNESLRHATGDWLFWMDSDDTIPPECGRGCGSWSRIRTIRRVLAYIMQVHCPGGREDGDRDLDVTVVDHVKLFRNLPELRFDGRIHEQILAAIRRLGGRWLGLICTWCIQGRIKARRHKRGSFERDLRSCSTELAERPEHPFTLFNLGMTSRTRSARRGGKYLRRSISRSNPGESHLRAAYAC